MGDDKTPFGKPHLPHTCHDDPNIQRIEEKLDLLMRWVSGNGDIRRGLLARVYRVEIITTAILFVAGGIGLSLVALFVQKVLGGE